MSTLGADPTLGVTSTIGRYFGVVSVVPSLFFGVWTYLLLASRPWDGAPDLSAIMRTNPLESVALGAALILFSMVVAVVTHPLQFLTVQLFEGYWGPGPLARAWQGRRILSHLRRRDALVSMTSAADESLDNLKTELCELPDEEIDWPVALKAGSLGPVLSAALASERGRQALFSYPQSPSNVMPTRLGNVLRRYEASAGAAVGLDLISWANHIGMVAEPSHTAYVQDQRNGMDLAVRMTATCLAMFAITFLLLWPYGVWLLAALLPLAGAWLSYRGSVVAADSYGRALTAWLHLNRFRLYEELNLSPVANADDERTRNGHLEDLILGQPEFESQYQIQTAKRQSTDEQEAPGGNVGGDGLSI